MSTFQILEEKQDHTIVFVKAYVSLDFCIGRSNRQSMSTSAKNIIKESGPYLLPQEWSHRVAHTISEDALLPCYRIRSSHAQVQASLAFLVKSGRPCLELLPKSRPIQGTKALWVDHYYSAETIATTLRCLWTRRNRVLRGQECVTSCNTDSESPTRRGSASDETASSSVLGITFGGIRRKNTANSARVLRMTEDREFS